MRYIKFLRILGTVLILSLLAAAIPAAPVMAAYEIELHPDEGSIGDVIEITGLGFGYTVETDRMAKIIFAKDEAKLYDDIGIHVTTYETVKWIEVVQAYDGSFETTFEVPDELNDGTDDEDVSSGEYFIYVTVSSGGTESPDIRAIAQFTVIAGEIEIDPEEGPVDTLVEITGTGFTADESIEIEYHDGSTTVDVPIEDLDDETDNDGEFVSIIRIPESTAGDHVLRVIVGSAEVEVEFNVEPDLIITPQSGEADTEITVSGTGFGKRKEVEIWFDDNIGVATERTGSNGSFSATFVVPPGLESGIYNVDAEDGTNVARAKFTLTVAPPPPPTPEPTPTPTPPPTPEPTTALNISQQIGSVGSPLMIGGAGYQPNEIIKIMYDDVEIGTATASEAGFFTAQFQVPPSKAGEHTIKAGDSEIKFVVESIPPGVPPPLLPEMGVKVESPIVFDWKEVVDDSVPVTYTLQIATAKDFVESALVLERTDLKETKYTLTEAEELKLAGQEKPYYWRIRAIDAASNEGEWTGAGEFFVTTPFSFPSWALYTLLGIGAVLIFGIGYWLGRRTAFYY